MAKVWFFWEWVDEREIEMGMQEYMRAFDTLPPVVRSAVREATAYIAPATAAELVKIYGAEIAAKMIMARGEPE